MPFKNYDWTPAVAYAVGLLVTDGNLSGDGRHVTLRSCDLEQLENFKKCLGMDTPIKAPKTLERPGGNTCYRIQFSNIQLYRWLQQIGLFPHKTYTIGALTVPDQFFRDFLRGHLDGDGTITTYQDRYNIRKNSAYLYIRFFVRFISASRSHLEWLRTTITRLTGLKGDFFEIKPRQKNRVSIWQLKFMKKEAIKLVAWLYYDPDLPSLTRKRVKAEQAIQLMATTKRKVYTRTATL